MITFGLGSLALITEGLGIVWYGAVRQQVILRPSYPVDIETIVITDVTEELEFDD